jgi:glycosyltransferase involved in cell wall biosynthesis
MIHFSVIIPNFNHAPFLKQRIDSVLAQTISPLELIILDDRSSDNSKEIIESYRDNPLVAHIIFNEENSGSPFIQWSKGILVSAGNWVWIAESDDVADEHFLEGAQLAISQNPDTAIFYCDSTCISEDKKQLRFNTYSEAKNRFFKTTKWSADHSINGKEEIDRYLKWICSINNSSAAVFRKEYLVEILDKLETFKYHGDWYCQLALASRGNISYQATPMNSFRLHEHSFLRHMDPLQSKLECFRILDQLYKMDHLTEKKELLDFFALQYLGFGFISDGFRYGKNLFRSYSAINKELSGKVWRSLLRQKLTGKKHRVIF